LEIRTLILDYFIPRFFGDQPILRPSVIPLIRVSIIILSLSRQLSLMI